METRPDPVLSQPKPQMTSSSFSESHQTQSSSVQQSSSSYSHQEASRQVFESQEFNGGYQAREDVANQQSNTGERNIQDSGLFGGIGGDRNSLVDAEFDYKKHSVKDLAKHFALVKPKQDISHNILPEQRMYNGNNGPALNYLSSETSQTSSSSVTTSRREVSQQDVEASKRAYEMKKQQQQLDAQQTSQQTSQQSSQTTVVRREESSSSSAEQQTKTERRQSLSQALLMDPALAHAEAGIIDPSAILRGESATQWNNSDPSTPKTSLRTLLSSPSCAPPRSSPLPPRARAYKPVRFQPATPSTSTLPPLPSSTEQQPDPQISCQSSSQTVPPEYQATVQTSNQHFPIQPSIVLDQSNLENVCPNILHSTSTQTNTNTKQSAEKKSVIQTMLKNTSGQCDLSHDEMAVSLSFPEVSRSSNVTPAPTTPFPSLEAGPAGLVIPPSPTVRPRTPILVTTRPSSVSLDRTRHVSKDDIARMMAELNAPLPPMLQIPQEIRASPLIFSGGRHTPVVCQSQPSSVLSSSTSSTVVNTTTSQTFHQ